MQHPTFLADYICPTLPSISSVMPSTIVVTSLDTAHLLSHFVSYHNFSINHFSFLFALSQSFDPTRYSQSAKHYHWYGTMQPEIWAIETNHTWLLIPLPPVKKPIDCKWIFKTKLHANGSIERYKARLVAKGYTKAKSLDYHDIFAPIAKVVAVHCVLTIVATCNWHLY